MGQNREAHRKKETHLSAVDVGMRLFLPLETIPNMRRRVGVLDVGDDHLNNDAPTGENEVVERRN